MATATPAVSRSQGRQLAELILAESARAGLGAGGRLPTERQLAADMGVTRSAVRHAMKMLEAEGRISREVGRGTFLRDLPEPATDGRRDSGQAFPRGSLLFGEHPLQFALRSGFGLAALLVSLGLG